MRDLRSIAGWLANELQAIGGYAREPQLWLALAIGLTLWTLAYQPPYSYRLDIGGNRATDRQRDDVPFLTGFNKPEPESLSDSPAVTPQRWTTDDATIRLPGIGGGRWNVAILAAGRPDGVPIESRWSDGSATTRVTVGKHARVYQMNADADRAGDLALRFESPEFRAPDDPRSLGFVMRRVEVESRTWGRPPPADQLAWLGIALALIYSLCRRLAFTARGALAIGLALAALAAALLLRERMALTLFTPTLARILAGAYALGVTLDAIYRRLSIRPPAADRRITALQQPALPLPHPIVSAFVAFPPRVAVEPIANHLAGGVQPFVVRRPSFAVALVVLALLVRLGGLLHPHAIFSDVRMNVTNLYALTSGNIYFTEELPLAAGSGKAPYPPGQYIVMAPAQLVFGSDRDTLGTAMVAGNALLDSLAVGLLWYLLRRSGYGERGALLGAALYLLPAPILKSLSIGELANVFGQTLALPLLAVLAIQARRLHTWPAFGATAILLGMALLGHLGVTISLFCLLGYLGLAWLIRLETRRAVRALLGAGLLAGAAVAFVYHTALLDVLRDRAGALSEPAARPVDTLAFADKLRGLVGALPAFGLQPFALALGLLGAILIALRPRMAHGPGPRPALGALLIAWWGGTLLSLGLLLFANQGVRWAQFLYPALCLGAGPALAALWSRGRAGRVLAVALLGFLIWFGLEFWVVQIRDYLH